MQIVEYESKNLEDVRDLLVELEKYILTIDEDHLDQLHSEYREKMALLDLEDVNSNNGKCYLACIDDEIVGLIMGYVIHDEEYDYLDYKCPKRGFISELVVTNKLRSSGVGKELVDTIENYFKSIDCKYVFVDAFAYNKNAISFYEKHGYHSRMYTMLKEIK